MASVSYTHLDASLTAIYGAKGGNGVVIVTTKSAQQGKMKVEFNASAQMRTLARKLDLSLIHIWDFFGCCGLTQTSSVGIADGA